VLDERFGKVWAARLVLLLLLTPVLVALGGATRPRKVWRRPPARPLLVGAGVVGVALLATPGPPGTPRRRISSPGPGLRRGHLVSSACGSEAGLLVAAVLPRRRAGELADVVPGSPAWRPGVVTILVTGTFQGWREVRSTAALTGTTYGRLLMIKFGLFTLMVALAALSGGGAGSLSGARYPAFVRARSRHRGARRG